MICTDGNDQVFKAARRRSEVKVERMFLCNICSAYGRNCQSFLSVDYRIYRSVDGEISAYSLIVSLGDIVHSDTYCTASRNIQSYGHLHHSHRELEVEIIALAVRDKSHVGEHKSGRI